MEEVFIVAISRTPIGSLGGSLSSVPATQLGTIAIQAALEKAGISPKEIEEVYMGNVLTANEGQAPARQAALGADIPTGVPCTTINKVCSSGLKAIMLSAQSILLGERQLMVAGGMESMSNTPYYLSKARSGYRLGHGEVTDGLVKDGLWDPYNDFHMGNAAELCAAKYKLSREEQDAFAAESYRRVAAAYEQGYFQKEIAPVEVKLRKETVTVAEDEEYKKVNYEKIPKLRSAFQKDGTITAANASKINDGAAAVILASGEKVKELGVKPLVKIRSFADAAQAPEWFTTTPSIAMEQALKKAGLSKEEIDFAEINEAFSCVPMANARLLELPSSKVNVWGGAVALGHPLGCSGARIIVTLTNILRQKKGKYGLAGICNGGGGASSMLIERV